ncbi:MAG: HesA/MoeB/ThiF family protein [Pelolinea sp.]|jgi:adenylyltransferase/sulfurtransferase|nr:HesA/MoeB/ThiF family protein [Pelolinea sp.]
MKALNEEERERYQRHLCIPELGEAGQLKIKAGSVLVVGAGGLGSAVLLYLAAAGVGRLGIVDSDVVELSNLQRQILYDTEHLGIVKTELAFQRLHALNPHVELKLYQQRFEKQNALKLMQGYAIVMDGTDNFETRFLINDLCVKSGKPYIYGAINQFHGQVSVFDAKKGACFRCVYPAMPSEEIIAMNKGVGVVGAVPGIIGSIEALECIKILTGIGDPLYGRMILLDGQTMEFREIQIRKQTNCPICAAH